MGLSVCAGCACALAGAFPYDLLAAAAIEQYTAVAGGFGTAFSVAGMIVGVSSTTRTVVEGDGILEVATTILLAGSMTGGLAAAIGAGLAALGVHVGRRSLRPGSKFQLVRQGGG